MVVDNICLVLHVSPKMNAEPVMSYSQIPRNADPHIFRGDWRSELNVERKSRT